MPANSAHTLTHLPSTHASRHNNILTPLTPCVLCVNSKGNNIGDDGAKALAPALAELKALTTLGLSGKYVLG